MPAKICAVKVKKKNLDAKGEKYFLFKRALTPPRIKLSVQETSLDNFLMKASQDNLLNLVNTEYINIEFLV